MLWRGQRLVRRGVAVKIKVIKKKIDWGRQTTISPVFEVLEGEYKGQIAKSEVGTSLGVHSSGAVLNGIYCPETGAIESQTTLVISKLFSWAVILGTGGFIIWRHIVPYFVP